MITKDLKISELLEQYPESLEILMKVSPHFRKLQNKMLRKALAGRVTVEQAASIAGVNLLSLLSELNSPESGSGAAANDSAETGENTSALGPDKPAYLQTLTNDAFTTLDVRPILDGGKDPLKEILHEVKNLKNGNALLIVNSFEPVPLYDLLGNKGYSHWTERVEDCWKVYFYRESENPNTEPDIEAEAGSFGLADFENVIELDVHDLPAPEPMIKVLENLGIIDEKSVMLVHHHREPVLLYPKLRERGYEAVCEKLAEEKYRILIAKRRST